MDINQLIADASFYIQNNIFVSIFIFIFFILVVFFRPKILVKCAAAAVILIAVAYCLSMVVDMTQTGIAQKQKMTNKYEDGAS